MKSAAQTQRTTGGDYWTEATPASGDQVLSFRWRTPDPDLIRSLGVPATDQSRYAAARNSILTEAMLAHAEARWVSFSRRKEYYANSARYHGSAYTFCNVVRAVDELVRLKLIEEDRSSPQRRGRQSRLRAAPKLVEGWSGAAIIYDLHEIIRLKDREGKLVDYRDTDNTRRMRRDLDRLNAELATIAVELAATDAGVVRTSTHLKVDGQFYRWASPSLFRSFNRGSFLKGGRAYGWWQNLSRVRRPQLLINGEPTAEPDFTQMHAAMLYAEYGLILDGDAYDVDGFPRELVKVAFQVLLNTSKPQGAVSALVNRKGWFLTGTETGKLISALAHRHAGIADAFHADRGIALMRRDSDIILSALRRCLDSGIPALPIHDSMVTPRRHEAQVAEFMERSAAEELRMPNPCKVRVSSTSVPQMP